jgi:hypothetical protein
MPIPKVIFMDVSLSLAIAGLGALLVASSLGSLERWRITILARARGKSRSGGQRCPEAGTENTSYPAKVNVRMLAEGFYPKLRREPAISPAYGPSGLFRVQAHRGKRLGAGPKRTKARPVRRFKADMANEKARTRVHRLRRAAPEYANGN